MLFLSFLNTLALAVVARATITSPVAGDMWMLGKQSTVTWDPSQFAKQVDIAMVPAGATDASVIIAKIATAAANTGSISWTMPSSMNVGSACVMVYNSPSTMGGASVGTAMSTSGEVIIVVGNGGCKCPAAPKQPAAQCPAPSPAPACPAPVCPAPAQPAMTSKPANATTARSTSTVRLTTSIAPFANATTKQTTAAILQTATSTRTTSRPSAPLASATSGGGAAPQPVFTGAASVLESNRGQTVVSGGLFALMAMLFL